MSPKRLFYTSSNSIQVESELRNILHDIGVEKEFFQLERIKTNNEDAAISIEGRSERIVLDISQSLLESPLRRQIEAYILGSLDLRGLLFMCVQNSARSQLAEAIARHMAPPSLFIASAGSHPFRVRDEVFTVLEEVGIDTSMLYSKSVEDIDVDSVDAVITLCDEEVCPVYLHPAYRVHWGLPDPAKEALEQSRLQAFRRIRDELMTLIGEMFSG